MGHHIKLFSTAIHLVNSLYLLFMNVYNYIVKLKLETV